MNNTRTSARNVGRIPVEDIMATEVVYVGPRDTVREALELMLQNHVSAVPVVKAAAGALECCRRRTYSI